MLRLLILCSLLGVATALPAAEASLLRLATTTSTDNSGLLDWLLPRFEAGGAYRVQVIAAGTGRALRMGRDGDVDVVLVHAPAAEQAFVDAGYGERRYAVMTNDFVLVGPQSAPAAITGATDIVTAMQALAGSDGALFLSRGDDSGTHKKEIALWRAAGITPSGPQQRGHLEYRETGQGMGRVLQMSGELDAYTLTDRGTWLAYTSQLPLRIVFEGDSRLFNPYSIIAVNPKRYPNINHVGAQALIDWLVSPTGQRLIGDFRIGGQRLFTPAARDN